MVYEKKMAVLDLALLLHNDVSVLKDFIFINNQEFTIESFLRSLEMDHILYDGDVMSIDEFLK